MMAPGAPTTEDPSITTDAASPPTAKPASRPDVATLRSRIGGYVVDMVILSAIAMVVSVVAGFFLLLATDFANDRDAQDSDMYIAACTLLIGTAGGWSILNLALLATRGQTGGQYVAGLRLARDDGRPLSFRDAAVWWFCLNPLLFSWPMAASAGTALLIITGLSAADALLFASLLVMTLCVVLPLVALVAAIFDARNRALHDRVAGTVVVSVQ
jgi:uncharacterized RDD family membrane protein YckC